MVVLAMAICTKNGKALLSRQYVDMTRIRIEGILAAFPKLIGYSSDASSAGRSKDSARQHTFVETETVRYVYQPIESLNIVVITTKGSNIIQDLETLRLISKIIPDYCQPISEETISEHVFELIFAFDEVITLGYKEDVSLPQIRTNLEMDSHEEKLHMMVRASKESEARDEGRRKAAAIRAAGQAADAGSMSKYAGAAGIGSTGFGNTPSASGFGPGDTPGFTPSSSGFGSNIASGSTYGQDESTFKKSPVASGMKLGKGLSLKKKQRGSELISQMAEEEGMDATALEEQRESAAAVAAPGAVVRTEPIEVTVAELITLNVSQDGAIHEFQVKGELLLSCQEEDQRLRLHLAPQERKPIGDFRLRPNPQLSKPDLSKQVLQMRKADRPFPKNQMNLLKWEMNSTDEALVPLKIVVWPEDAGDGKMFVNVTFNLGVDLALQNVIITIPLNSSESPEIVSSEGGVYRHNSRRQRLEWEINLVDSNNPEGILEFEVPSKDKNDFFPVTVQFSSEETMYPVDIATITSVDNDEPLKFGRNKKLAVERYEVVASD